ncbi:DUF167 domain-containing protein [Candidatus Electronema sp. PJ]|uniref:DUF167 domain-containing protein n=1 Tax=Candidatus Electronema sp. PJ TaxID=3401572 RepID=UPI003AA7F45D
MPCLQARPDGSLLLSLHVQPGAARTELAGLHGDALKLRLAAPPIDGRANKAVVDFIAELLHLPKSAVVIRSGLASRTKKLLLTGIAENDVRSLLEQNRGSSNG